MADGIMSQAEEAKLREFRKAAEQLERASADRLMLDARYATISTENPETPLNELTRSVRQPGLNHVHLTGLELKPLYTPSQFWLG